MSLGFKPTDEQEVCAEVFKDPSVKWLTIQARSGSGKSSTLRYLAHLTTESVIYLAFNKAMALEAAKKMPNNVECRTLHSLCYSFLDKNLRSKLTRPEGKYVNVAGTGSEISKKYKISNLVTKEGLVMVTRGMLGLMVKETVGKYEFSDDKHITHKHFPHNLLPDIKKRFPSLNEKVVINEVVKCAKKLWRDRIDPKSDVLMTHDTYVKLFELSGRDIGFSVIFGDEFQDVNPTFVSILRNAVSAKKIVVVGDEFQCVSENTKLKTHRGEILMKDLQVGDEIESYSNGKIVFKKVTNKTLSTRKEGRNITTSGDKNLDMTNNHLIWASSYVLKKDQMIVYLMWRKDLGFRVGITNKFDDKDGFSKMGQRTRSERAQKLWVLDIVDNREIALEYETTYSLKYGIPTCVYEAEVRGINQQRINNVFSKFGQNGFKVLEDKEYHFNYPHWHSINSSEDERKMLTVNLLAQSGKGNQVQFEWKESDMNICEKLTNAGICYSNAKNVERFRVRKYFKSYKDALKFSQEVLEVIPFASVKETISFPGRDKYSLIPSSGLFKGMSVLTKNGDVVIPEVILDIKDSAGVYYDIEVEDTANFFGNGILSHNCIYQFRGSENMMGITSSYGKETYLTACFRFGDKVATLANKMLSWDKPMTGELSGVGFNTVTGGVRSNLIDTSKPYTIIYRKNMTLLLDAMDKIASGELVSLNVDVKDFVSMVDSVNALRRGEIEKIRHESILPYTTWQEFVDDAEVDPDAKRLLNIIVSGKAQEIAFTLRQHKNPKNAKIVLTTAHKCKGLEWEQVIIANDFPSIYNKEKELVGLNDSERNLLYVAHTRAIKVLKWNNTMQEVVDLFKVSGEQGFKKVITNLTGV